MGNLRNLGDSWSWAPGSLGHDSWIESGDLAQELSIAEPGRREALFDSGGGGPPVTDLSQ